jgi:hypothetical protein
VSNELEYGPVVVDDPKIGPRIGYYDDDETDLETGDDVAIVYFCEPPFVYASYSMVDYSLLSPVDTDALWSRRERLQRDLAERAIAARKAKRTSTIFKRMYDHSLELSYINSLLADRMMNARMNEGTAGGRRVFISYSSLDKMHATWLSVDLANSGHSPWLDEWEIKVGESIPIKISLGLEECDFVLVLLSSNSVGSGWVEREWSAKYWTEVQTGKASVIPVLLEDCEIPTLLRPKKYADLRHDYRDGLDRILDALRT